MHCLRKACWHVADLRFLFVQVTRAFGDTQLVISGATATMLAIGRFAALPYQRRIAESQVPMQNGETHEAAGDAYVPRLQQRLSTRYSCIERRSDRSSTEDWMVIDPSSLCIFLPMA